MMRYTKICVVCNKEFGVWADRVDAAQTCSRECRGRLDAKKYGIQRPSLRCKWCAKLFVSPPSQAGRRVHCSKECADAAKIGGAFRLVADGAVTRHTDGYLLERHPDHPFNVSGYVLQHRLVMEVWMRKDAPDHHFLMDVDGVKYLRRDIDVHHRNEVKDDNAISNLMACTSVAHLDIHDGRPLMRGSIWPESGDEIEGQLRRVTKQCLECANSFETNLSSILRGGGKFCSHQCAARQNGKKRANKVARNCVTCGAHFMSWPSIIAAGGGKFCSNECRHKSRLGRNPKVAIPYP